MLYSANSLLHYVIEKRVKLTNQHVRINLHRCDNCTNRNSLKALGPNSFCFLKPQPADFKDIALVALMLIKPFRGS